MSGLLLSLRLLLAAVFSIAAIGKLSDREGTSESLKTFGVPTAWSNAGSVVLPALEVLVAVALVASGTAWIGALAAVVLLCTFSAALLAAMARGSRPDCHCFGQLHSGTAGPGTVARNLLLALAALVVIIHGPGDTGTSATAWVAHLSGTTTALVVGGVLAAAAIAGQWALILGLLRQNGRILLRLQALESGAPGVAAPLPGPQHGLPIGTPAPDFELSSIDDGRVSLRALRADRRWVLLTFIDPACGSCHALLPEIARAQAAAASGVVAVISRGSKDENRASAVEHDLNNVLLQNGDVSEQYRVPGTPSAVLIDSAGRLAGPVAAGLEPVRALLDRVQDGGSSQLLTVHSSAGSPSGVQIGEPLPDIRLRQLEGEERLISDAAGSDAIIVFWNQSCRFCQQMIDALRRHEREYAGTVVVISSSSVEQNRQIGIAGPVLCDPERQAMQAFAASGTPMAVRVSEGRVAGRLVAGEEALLALFKGEPMGAHA